jgi:uncharacterized RDD family membrane protein YckC
MTDNAKGTADQMLGSFTDRLIAFVIDLIVLLLAIAAIISSLHRIDDRACPWVMLLLLLGYFVGLTASPVRGTLGKLVQGLRVVDYDGNTLKPWRAVLRSSVLAALLFGAISVVQSATDPRPPDPSLFPLAIGSMLLLFSAAVTPRRQALHDLLARSIVVRKDALQRPDANECIRYVVGGGARRPSVFSILGNVLVVSLPAFLLFTTGPVYKDMNLRARVAYAVQETSNLRSLVEDYYTLEGSFPPNAVSLGVAAETPYPDGGYYRLEEEGAIRIGLTVLPSLKDGSMLLEPSTDNNGAVHWDCTVHGNLADKYVPADGCNPSSAQLRH